MGDGLLGHGNWNLTDGSANWESGGLSGRVLHAQQGQWPTLLVESSLGAGISLVFGKLSYSPHGEKAKESFPAPTTFLIQEPYLVVPHAIASEVGLRMVVQFLAEPGGLTMDVRLETIAPLDNVSLTLDLALTGHHLHTSAAKSHSDRYSRREIEWADVGEGEKLVGGLVTDLGEGGHAERQGDGWRLVLFDQPLEKGVILVGRWGIVKRGAGVSAASFRQKHQGQLDRPTFL